MPELIHLDLPHVRLAAHAWGDVGAPLAVLLHGFPDTAWSWRHLGPALASRGWRAVAPYTRGYGPSGVPDDGRTDVGALVADAVAVHAPLGGRDDAVLIGHDWGAVTSNALAAHRDSPFARVVSMSVPPFAALRRTATLSLLPGQLRRSWYIGYHQLPFLPERSLDRLVPRLWRAWSPAYDASADVPRVLEALGTPERRRTAIDYYRHLARPVGVPEEYRRWQAASFDRPRVPLLYLHGADDGCLTAALAPLVERVLPAGSAVHVVPDAGHFLQLEQPAGVEALVADFLG